MTKVIKEEFEKIKDVKVKDVSLTYDTSLEVFNNEVNRLSGMDDNLFTYEVEVANIPCDSKIDDDSEHETNDDMGYDPSDVAFTEWLGSKNFNYKTMDHYTMKALWIFRVRGDDQVELTYEESSDDKDEVAEVFRIDTNLFNFETPICKAFKEFNYLLQVNPDLLRTLRDSRPMKITRVIGFMNGTRMYHGLMRSHGLTLEFGPNPHQLNIFASLSTIRLDVQNGQYIVGRIMDTVMEETYPELTLLETNSIIRITNGPREGKIDDVGDVFTNMEILKCWSLETSRRYVVPTGRVKVPAGRYVVPTGKENVIVSPGRTKVIPVGRTILVLVVLFLLVEQY
ncbi:hypothetical protein Tco_1539981 [Tanacetum coccineum]